MSLPKEFVEKGLALKDSKLFGTPLASLSHEELLAAAALGWKNYQTLKEENSAKDVAHMRELAAMSQRMDRGFKFMDKAFDEVFHKDNFKTDKMH